MMDGRDSHIPNERPENSRFDPGLKNTYKGLKPLRPSGPSTRRSCLKNTYKGFKLRVRAVGSPNSAGLKNTYKGLKHYHGAVLNPRRKPFEEYL